MIRKFNKTSFCEAFYIAVTFAQGLNWQPEAQLELADQSTDITSETDVESDASRAATCRVRNSEQPNKLLNDSFFKD